MRSGKFGRWQGSYKMEGVSGDEVMPSRDDLVWERDEVCDVCRVLGKGKGEGYVFGFGTDRHHGFFNRMKGLKILDVKYNLFLVCKFCHEKLVWGDEIKKLLWDLQVERYGKEVMLRWWNQVPFSDKPRFWLLGRG